MLNAVGDLFDIIPAVEAKARVDWASLSPQEAAAKHGKMGHCSGLVKVPADFRTLFLAHSSWFTYSNTDRIYKHYTFDYSAASQTAAHTVAFSSYPGFLESLDDFYELSSGLAWVQTTNGVVDKTVYEQGLIKPQSLLAWQRVRVASSMSSTGEEWRDHMRTHFSGTYANQYMVVDTKRFTPSRPLQEGTLWIVEEMPGLLVGADKTETLARGYWPSYNVPFFPEVYNRSGYPAMAAKSNYFSYELAPRAQIFRRDQAMVVDIPSFQRIMRYNDYRRDPLSFDGTAQNPMYAICSRGDLKAAGPETGGCYDTKLANHTMLRGLEALVINGPSESKGAGDLPPFHWSQFPNDTTHAGLPAKYDFDWVRVKPEL